MQYVHHALGVNDFTTSGIHQHSIDWERLYISFRLDFDAHTIHKAYFIFTYWSLSTYFNWKIQDIVSLSYLCKEFLLLYFFKIVKYHYFLDATPGQNCPSPHLSYPCLPSAAWQGDATDNPLRNLSDPALPLRDRSPQTWFVQAKLNNHLPR